MNREEGMELVQRSIDGDLNEEESSRLQAYLAQYPECAALLEKLTRLSAELTQLPHVAPRYSLVDAILPQLELIAPEPAPGAAEEAPYEPRSRRTGSRKTLYRGVLGVVAAGIVAGVLLIAQPFSLLPKPDQQQSASRAEALPQSSPAGEASADMLRTQNKLAVPSASAEQVAPVDEGAAAASDGGQQDTAAAASSSTGDAAAPTAQSGGEASAEARGYSSPASGAQAPTPGQQEPTPGKQDKIAAAGPINTPKADAPGVQGFAPSAPASADDRDKGKTGEAEAGGGPAATQAPALAGEPNMTFSIAASEPEWKSPDGSLAAIADAGTIRIAKIADGGTVFESDSREGTISDVTWGQDGKDLYYTWTDASGKKTDLWWNAKENREQAR